MNIFFVKVILIKCERARDWQKKIYFDKSEFPFQFETGDVWGGQGMKGGIIHDSDLVSHVPPELLCRATLFVQKGENQKKVFWSGDKISSGQGRGQRPLYPASPL